MDGLDGRMRGVSAEDSGPPAYDISPAYEPTESCCGGTRPFESSSEVFVGSYRLIELLGEGATSRVYAAEHFEHGQRVALKVMLEQHNTSLTKVMRFLLECELLARVQHPNVVRLLERSENGAAERFSALELLEGETLRDKLYHEGTLPPRQVIGIAIQLASALEAVHAAGVIHCDVKPDNVHVTTGFGRQTVKLFDFDAARWMDRVTGRSTAILPTGAVLGTPGYMAPEQEQGAFVNAKADIYAFGATLYELLTGAAPYMETTLVGKIRTCLFATPKPLRSFHHLQHELPASFENLVRACVERAPEKRPATITDVIVHLRTIEREIDAEPPSETAQPHNDGNIDAACPIRTSIGLAPPHPATLAHHVAI